MKTVRIIINDKFNDINQKRVEESDGISLSAIRASRLRLQEVLFEQETVPVDKLVDAVQVEIDVLSYAAERYADINEEGVFAALNQCVEDYKELRDELLSMKE